MKNLKVFYALLLGASSLFAMNKRSAEEEAGSSCTVKKERKNAPTIKLESNDGQIFEVEYDQEDPRPTPINLMGTVKNMIGDLRDLGDYNSKSSITLPVLNSSTLRAILTETQRLSTYLIDALVNKKNTWSNNELIINDLIKTYPFIKKQNENGISDPDLIDLLMAANFLDINPLIKLIYPALAQQIHACTDTATIELMVKKIDFLPQEMQLPLKKELEVLGTIQCFNHSSPKILAKDCEKFVLSPNSRYLFGTKNNNGYIWDMENVDAVPIEFAECEFYTPPMAKFSPNNQLLASLTDSEAPITLVDIANKTSINLVVDKNFEPNSNYRTESDSPWTADFTWSPDSKYLATVFEGESPNSIQFTIFDVTNPAQPHLIITSKEILTTENAFHLSYELKIVFLNNEFLFLTTSHSTAVIVDLRDSNNLKYTNYALPSSVYYIHAIGDSFFTIWIPHNSSTPMPLNLTGEIRMIREKGELLVVTFDSLIQNCLHPELEVKPKSLGIFYFNTPSYLSSDAQTYFYRYTKIGNANVNVLNIIETNSDKRTFLTFDHEIPDNNIQISHNKKFVVMGSPDVIEIASTTPRNRPLTNRYSTNTPGDYMQIELSSDDSFMILNIIRNPEGEPEGTLLYLPLFSKFTASLSLAQTIMAYKLAQLGAIITTSSYLGEIWKSVSETDRQAIESFLSITTSSSLSLPWSLPLPWQEEMKEEGKQ